VAELTDLEITRLCAKAMGLLDEGVAPTGNGRTIWVRPDGNAQHYMYNPLGDDAQCFALVKRFEMRLQEPEGAHDPRWRVTMWNPRIVSQDKDLNRAICECVAKMEQAKASV